MASPRMISIPCRAKLSLLLIWMMCAAKTGRCQARPKQPRSYVLGPSQSQPVSSGKACGFYIWDAPSALLHRWCHHLQRDCIYEGTWGRVQPFRHLEFHCCLRRLPCQIAWNNILASVLAGRGGKRFVRVRPGSMLQLLHPCNRYSPDRCILCGGCYQDHLILGWAKHLYKPFDRLMDRMYDDSLMAMKASKPTTKKAAVADRSNYLVHAFHRRYVLDVSQSLLDKNGNKLPPKERVKSFQFQFAERYGSVQRRPMSVISTNNALFIPDRSPNGKRPSVLIGIFRIMMLNSVKDLYRLQFHDNAMRRGEKAE
jgi:hypothetical protein